MRKNIVVILLMCLASLSHSNFSFGSSNLFYPYQTIPVGSWPESVAIGDVNGDGRNDVVLVTSFYVDPDNDHHIFVFLQNQSGGLNPPIKYPALNVSSGPKSIDIGDLNNDGRSDVVVGNYDAMNEGNCYLGVFLQNDSGMLDPMVIYPTRKSYSVKVGDLNNDGLLDVAAIAWGLQPDWTYNNDVDVFLQNDAGSLDPPITYTVTHGGYDEIDINDINNDGLNDIIVMSGQYYAFPNIGVLIQKDDGTFDPAVYYDLGIDENTHGIATGDVNSDGMQDIVVTYGGNQPTSKIGIFLQNNTGIFNPAVIYSSYDCPEPVEVADVDHDGRQDIILAHAGWEALGVYLQNSNGTMIPEELYALPYASHYNLQGLAVGDINNDGLNDIVLADYNYGLILVYHRELPTNISVSPSSVDFSSIIKGTTSSQHITISNRGKGNLNIGMITIMGTNANQFSKQNDNCSSKTIALSSSCTFDVNFSPTSIGQKTAELKTPSNDPDSPTVKVLLSGKGVNVIVLQPNGGEIIPSGLPYSIQWIASTPALKFNLFSSINNGLTWLPIEKDIADTNYSWTVPPTLGNNKKCLLKVVAYDASNVEVGRDKSDAPFTIEVVKLESPNGGDTIACGVTNTITWTTNETKRDVTKVKLYYTKDGGLTWLPITALTDPAYLATGSHSYDQWIPTCTKPKINRCKVKVELRDSSGNLLGKDGSDGFFTIQP